MRSLAITFTLMLSAVLHAQNWSTTPLYWPDKQGPTFDGRIPEAEAKRLPLEWNEEKGQNIVWKTAYEGEGHSSPVIGGDLVWFTSATKDGKRMFVYALHRETGKVVHHRQIFENADPEDLGNPLNNYAAPSCVLEEDGVYVHFGTYGTAKLNPQTAETIWQRRDINVRHYRGPGSSPLLFENLLILTFDAIDQQFIMAVDKLTGQTVWKTQRTAEFNDLDAQGLPKMGGDYRKGFGTPSVIKVEGQLQLVSNGANSVYGYDPRTGKELWRLQHENMNAAARLVYADGVLYVNTGSERAHLLAVRIDASARGVLNAERVLWDRDRRNGLLASPVLVKNALFQVTGSGVGICVDLQTGEDVWAERVAPGKFIASPIATEDRIYFFSDAAFGVVLAADTKYRQLAENRFSDPITATPAVADGALFVRTKAHVMKIAHE